MMDLAATSFSESLFGKSGTSGTGFLGSLFSGAVASSSDGSSHKGGIETLFSGGSPLPKHAGGGVTNQPSIFGEAGPEAAVPLPGGQCIPVTLPQPPVANSNMAPANVTVIINGPPVDAKVQHKPDGLIEVILDQAEARSAGRAASGRGAFAGTVPQRLRG